MTGAMVHEDVGASLEAFDGLPPASWGQWAIEFVAPSLYGPVDRLSTHNATALRPSIAHMRYCHTGDSRAFGPPAENLQALCPQAAHRDGYLWGNPQPEPRLHYPSMTGVEPLPVNSTRSSLGQIPYHVFQRANGGVYCGPVLRHAAEFIQAANSRSSTVSRSSRRWSARTWAGVR